MALQPYQFDNANAQGDKEAVIPPNPPTLINKLSAKETNGIKDKINEVVGLINSGGIGAVPYLELRLKLKGSFEGVANTGLGLEVGDIVQGFSQEGVVWANAIYNGGDPDDRVNYTVVGESPSSDQNNIIRYKTIQYEGSVIPTQQQTAELINSLPTFTIADTIIQKFSVIPLEINFVDGVFYEVRNYDLNRLGKGTYGANGVTLFGKDLKMTYQQKATTEDIASLSTTEVFGNWNIGTQNISEYVNANAPITVQGQEVGYRLFRTSKGDYLFSGPAGTYGSGATQTSLNQFQPFARENDSFVDVPQIKITTLTSITTTTNDANGRGQQGRNVVIDNGANAINIAVNGIDGFVASYMKHGSGIITFVQGAGRTLVKVDGIDKLEGIAGSTATISSVGTKDYLRISNAT